MVAPSGLLPSFALIAVNLYRPARCRGSCALGRCHSNDFRRSTPGVLAPVRVILSQSIYA